MDIQETKNVWVAWTNTDCTEGRGRTIPKAVCAREATAIRLGKRGYIQGSDCPVSEVAAVMVDNQWLVPGVIHPESQKDAATQKKVDEKRAAIKKAKDAGLTDDDLKLLASPAQ